MPQDFAAIAQIIEQLAKTQVVVGIPAGSPPRQDAAVSNALLGFVHEFGSPAQNIPARPFLRPGIEENLGELAQRLRQCAERALDGNAALVDQGFHSVGLAAQSFVKEKITRGPFAPLSPRTMAARRRKHKNRKAATPADVTPLIDTGQLRAAITYAIRKES